MTCGRISGVCKIQRVAGSPTPGCYKTYLSITFKRDQRIGKLSEICLEQLRNSVVVVDEQGTLLIPFTINFLEDRGWDGEIFPQSAP